MPKLSRADFAVNAKVYSLFCKYCNTACYSQKPRAMFCSSTCRAYSHKDKGALTPPLASTSSPPSRLDPGMGSLVSSIELEKESKGISTPLPSQGKESGYMLLHFKEGVGERVEVHLPEHVSSLDLQGQVLWLYKEWIETKAMLKEGEAIIQSLRASIAYEPR